MKHAYVCSAESYSQYAVHIYVYEIIICCAYICVWNNFYFQVELMFYCTNNACFVYGTILYLCRIKVYHVIWDLSC